MHTETETDRGREHDPSGGGHGYGRPVRVGVRLAEASQVEAVSAMIGVGQCRGDGPSAVDVFDPSGVRVAAADGVHWTRGLHRALVGAVGAENRVMLAERLDHLPAPTYTGYASIHLKGSEPLPVGAIALSPERPVDLDLAVSIHGLIRSFRDKSERHRASAAETELRGRALGMIRDTLVRQMQRAGLVSAVVGGDVYRVSETGDITVEPVEPVEPEPEPDPAAETGEPVTVEIMCTDFNANDAGRIVAEHGGEGDDEIIVAVDHSAGTGMRSVSRGGHLGKRWSRDLQDRLKAIGLGPRHISVKPRGAASF